MDFNSYLNTTPIPGSEVKAGGQPAPTVPPIMPNQIQSFMQPMNGSSVNSAGIGVMQPADGQNYYYPYYMPTMTQFQGTNYYPAMTPQMLMDQFAQFMSMMGNGMQVPNPTPVIEGQKYPPPDNYTCNRCKQKGHWIQYCPYAKKKPSYCIQNGKIECKTCKKWFISEEKKKEHLALHETCPYPNCSFSAVEKVLSAHIASVHQKKETRIPPSLLELIPEKYRYVSTLGNNPEEIKKWREERKRRYPTQDNIQKKNEAEKAIEEAGGLVPQEKKLKETVPSEKNLYEVIQGKRLALCKHYLQGTCKNGTNCNYLHDPCRKNKELCKAFVRGYCSRGMNCKKLHNPNDRLLWLKQKNVEPMVPSLLCQLMSNEV